MGLPLLDSTGDLGNPTELQHVEEKMPEYNVVTTAWNFCDKAIWHVSTEAEVLKNLRNRGKSFFVMLKKVKIKADLGLFLRDISM